ncbi:hypothetical protein B0H17DRAFT_1208873 [Mycena rosella]|uniref:Short-chain dehydrogenase/reductase n=1 Tax=Mycena rosella TaxID=1033263 RepID=A0AAD7CZS6_MYCRO|nr:hypothetical protein B0H17DRAFT_1208873 [Mycena rosella]
MATIAKTIVATGASSGLGFEAIKQLLQQTQPYKFILGVRDTTQTQAAYDALRYDAGTHSVALLPLELSDLRAVRTFAQQALDKLGDSKIDILMLNAAMSKGATDPAGPHGSKWCEPYVVNHLATLSPPPAPLKLTASRSRIVVVSSGAIRSLRDQNPTTLDTDLLAGSGADHFVVYCGSKFVQLLGAHYWRRQLQDTGCTIVAVSPGFIPLTGLGRNSDFKVSMDMPDAKSVEVGAQSILAAFTRDDLPADPEQLFLTSWGEWWPKDVYASSLDTQLQDSGA